MSNSNNNNSCVPKLRFPEFTGEWEEKELNECFEERNEQYPESDEYPLMAFVADKGISPKGEKYDRSALVKDTTIKKYKRTELCDFIYSSNNLESGSIGLNKYGKACISPVYSIFESKVGVNSTFIGTFLTRKSFISEMIRYRQGVVYGQWKIPEKEFLKIKIHIPTLAEQQKIAECLTEMDNLISAQAQKVELLKTHKKGLMQQLFPQPGETTPQLRFPGFTGEWEEKKLGEVFERINNGASYNTYLTEGFPMSRIETISTGKIDYSHVGYSDIKPDSKYKLEVGDILFSHINSESRIGRIAKYNGEHPLYHGMNLLLLRASESNNKDFVYYQMDREEMRKQIQRFAKKAINQASVSTADLKRVTAMFPPTHIEQKKIAECLSESDKTIEAESAKLEALKAHKKGLMQQLFPEPIK